MIKNVVHGLGNRVLTVGLSFLTTILLARVLGPADFGDYAFLLTVIAILGTLVNFGQRDFLIRHVGSGVKESRKFEARKFIRFSFSLYLVLALIVSGIFLIVRDRTSSPVFLWEDPQALAVLLIVPIVACNSLLTGALNGLGKIAQSIWIGESLRLVLFCCLILVVVSLGLSWSLHQYLYLYALSAIAVTASLGLALARELKGARWIAKSSAPLRPRITESGALAVVAVIIASYQQVDILLLGFLADATSLGEYHAGNRISSLLTFIPAALIVPLAPRIAELHRAENLKDLDKLFAAACISSGAIVLTMAVVIYIFAPIIISLSLGSEYTGAISILRILLWARVADAIGLLFIARLKMTGKSGFALLIMLGGLVLNAVLNVMLIPKFGAHGAAYATSAAWVCSTLVLVFAPKMKSQTVFWRGNIR